MWGFYNDTRFVPILHRKTLRFGIRLPDMNAHTPFGRRIAQHLFYPRRGFERALRWTQARLKNKGLATPSIGRMHAGVLRYRFAELLLRRSKSFRRIA